MKNKKPLKNVIVMRCWKLIHFFTTSAFFALFWLKSYYNNSLSDKTSTRFLTMIVVYMAMMPLLLRTYGAYRISLSRVRLLSFSQSLSQLVCTGLIYVLTCINALKILNPLPVIILLIFQTIINMLWSLGARHLYFSLNPIKPVILIYQDSDALERINEVVRFKKKFEIIEKLPASLGKEKIFEEIRDCKALFIALDEGELRSSLIKYCVDRNIDNYISPQVSDILISGADHMEMFYSPIVRVVRNREKWEYMFIKRCIDIVCSFIGILILSPFMIITALAVKMYDGGPALYKQVRLTKDGKEFEILKFRSMRMDAEKDGVARLASSGDSRITPVGKFIRACRLDELPQLFNIFKGDMTIVGPRPERPEIARQYYETLPEFSLRLQVKAGLTGFAQIYGKYNTSPEEKLKMDLMYINQMSLTEDLKLIFATVKILFMKESTAGVAEGQVTAEKEAEVIR